VTQLRSAPTVSVVMPVYNAERYLHDAVDGILAQTLRDFELVVIDDGSTDSSPAILRNYASHDTRVRVYSQANLGIASSLSRGLCLATAPYVARMDADDVSLPHRLERQVAWLRGHSAVGLVGTAYWAVDASGRRTSLHRPPQSDTAIRWHMLFDNAFCHSSVMLQKTILDARHMAYDEEMRYAQDYDLWARMLSYTKAANLPGALVMRRVHEGSTQTAHWIEQQQLATEIARRQINALLWRHPLASAEVQALRELRRAPPGDWCDEQIALFRVLLDLMAEFREQDCIDVTVARKVQARWLVRLLARPVLAQPRVLWSSEVFRLVSRRDLLSMASQLPGAGWEALTRAVGSAIRR
jgi:glycosyltransferase involved in cell wall biosynthesis